MDNIALNHEDVSYALRSSDELAENMFYAVACGVLFGKQPYHCLPRVRNDYMLLLTLDGNAWVRQGACKRKLSRGCWFFLDRNHEHEYDAFSPWSFGYLHFDGAAADGLIKKLGFFSREHLCFRQTGSNAEDVLLRIIASGRDISINAALLRGAWIMELLCCLNRDYLFPEAKPDPVDRAKKYIDENYMHLITLDQLSEKAGLSRFYFSREFKCRTGFSPLDYVIRRRLAMAGKLLLSSDLKISQVALRCGFSDQFYFSRVFRRSFKCTPSEFKLRNLPDCGS